VLYNLTNYRFPAAPLKNPTGLTYWGNIPS